MKICLQQLAPAPFEKVDQRDAGDKPRATTQPSLDLGAGSEVGKCSGEGCVLGAGWQDCVWVEYGGRSMPRFSPSPQQDALDRL